MINHVSFQGRFTKDLELSYSQNQKPYVKFTVVWSEKSKNSNEKSCFLNCIAFNKLAENAATYFSKGKMAVVEGKLVTNKYQDQNGEDKYSTELIADRIHFCDGKNSSSEEEEDDATPFIN